MSLVDKKYYFVLNTMIICKSNTCNRLYSNKPCLQTDPLYLYVCQSYKIIFHFRNEMSLLNYKQREKYMNTCEISSELQTWETSFVSILLGHKNLFHSMYLANFLYNLKRHKQLSKLNLYHMNIDMPID